MLVRGDGGGGGLPVAQPGGRRPESHRPRTGRGARPGPHRGAARRAPAGWRAPILHPRLRLRVLEDPGRDLAALAAGHDPQGCRPDRQALPAADHRLGVQRHARGRPRAASGGGLGRHRSLPCRGRRSRFPELAREEGLAPWTPLKLYRSTASTPPRPRSSSRAARWIARLVCPITRSPWLGGACTARRTWDASRRSGPRGCRSRCSRTEPGRRTLHCSPGSIHASRRRCGAARGERRDRGAACWPCAPSLGRLARCRRRSWPISIGRSWRPPASCATRGATTIASPRGSASRSSSSAGTAASRRIRWTPRWCPGGRSRRTRARRGSSSLPARC